MSDTTTSIPVTTLVPASKIKLNPKNPRLIKDYQYKRLVESIKRFPQMLEIRPVVVDAGMVILGGNMRYRAAKEAGLKQIPIIKADQLTEDQKQEFIIWDNVADGEWDWDILANEWNEQGLKDWGLDIPIEWNIKEKEIDESIADGLILKSKWVLTFPTEAESIMLKYMEQIKQELPELEWKEGHIV